MTYQEAMAEAYKTIPAIDYKGMIRRYLGPISPEHKQEVIDALLSLAEELGGAAK